MKQLYNLLPDISVVLPVYNAEDSIADAIKSVLEQTFSNFELLIIDDGSTDKTWEVICSFNDKRIRKVKRDHNYIESLNWGLKHANGKYIARMDADDIMHRERLQIQYNIMEEDSSIDVCASWISLFGERAKIGKVCGIFNGYIKYPLVELLHENILFHPTILMRRFSLQKWNLEYSNIYPYAEDYYLWFQMASNGGNFYVESYPLLYYRVSQTQISIINRREQEKSAKEIKFQVLSFLISRICCGKKLFDDFYNSMFHLLEHKYIDDSFFLNTFYVLLKKDYENLYEKE